MTYRQEDFRSALLDPALSTPPGLVNPDGSAAQKRFDVYRNNVTVSLTDALETAFPVVAKLIGSENFRALAKVFLRQHPPSSPLLMFYGKEMPVFLEGFKPLQKIPYLADVARLELALRHSYHAAGADAFDPAVLQAMSEDALMSARITFAPHVQLIRSRYPVHGIWQMNMVDGAPQPQARGENVLVSRPALDPVMTVLRPGGGLLMDQLLRGEALGPALQIVSEKVEDFNLSETLIQLLQGAAIASIVGENP
ncbi:MAG: DNA-binding domain-containing protein [Pseudomonadota bacterium]